MRLSEELRSTKAALAVVEKKVEKMSQSPQVQQPWGTPQIPQRWPSTASVGVTPKKSDIVLPATDDQGATEARFMMSLQRPGLEAIEAHRDHNSLFRYLLKEQYGTNSGLLKNLKLKPISGVQKSIRESFERSSQDNYMTDNVFVALIKIGRDKFPGALTSNRVARRFLVYCLDNLKAKLRKTEISQVQATQSVEEAVGEATAYYPTYCDGQGYVYAPLMHPVMHPLDTNLNSTANVSDDSFGKSILDSL